MAQHDYVIANASGASVRADINNMALAISSNNSGSSEPSTKYAYLWWLDSSANVLKLRNSANNAWITMPFSITANNTVDINGGAIDGTNIGASAAGTGAFTTLAASSTTALSGDVTIAKTSAGADTVLKVASTAASGENDATVIINNGGTGDAMLRFDYESSTDRARIGVTTSAQALQFFTAGNNERMRILADGKVGIGTDTPSDLLTIQSPSSGGGNGITLKRNSAGTDQRVGAISFGNTVDTDLAQITAQTSIGNNGDGNLLFHTQPNGGSSTERMRITSAGHVTVGSGVNVGTSGSITMNVGSTSSSGGLQLFAPSNVAHSINFGDAYSSSAVYAGALEYNHSTNHMAFYTSSTERMRIDSDGTLLAGATSKLNACSIFGYAQSSKPLIESQNTSTGATNFFSLHRSNAGAEIGFINITNTGTTYDTGSDYRLKENITPIENGLERLNQLNPVKFDWKSDGTSSEGFIAHEVQEIFTDAVSGKKDAEMMQGMDYGRITPLLVKAIQEQQTIIEDLKTRIKTLEG